MNYISGVLYWISTGLLVPVVILLILFFIRSLLLIGNFFGQYVSIHKTESLLRAELDKLDYENVTDICRRLPDKNPLPVVSYIRKLIDAQNSPAHMQKLLDEFELFADKDLSVSKTLIKMGPMLGLMGTLIPMGPALVGLSTGDISSMAYNMQVAFATTVIGLFSSGIGFITLQVKQRWYVRDMSNLEFIVQVLTQKALKG
ncbi:MotA/TolQ/ExbB proton channel family protein [Phocaeicola abscessus]|uniref:MotA/TolQ/ExbB proton channel family protein n=1 Tax=Phocaeicola abscessus TaxID=555313 RepID=UPI0028EEE829|nr:MotA/TolQ/ExbB proton channel family protein [Phocaeicola abscessus]